jgi:hypothetical protein
MESPRGSLNEGDSIILLSMMWSLRFVVGYWSLLEEASTRGFDNIIIDVAVSDICRKRMQSPRGSVDEGDLII